MAASFAKVIRSLLAGAVLMAMAVGLQPAAAVMAHAGLVRSDPAAETVFQQPPTQVTIWFTEAIEVKLSSISVVDAQGKAWDDGDVAAYGNDPTALTVSLQKLPMGIYTVIWHNTSVVDGHSLYGSYAFYVGITPSGTAAVPGQSPPLLQSPLEPFWHWLELLALLAIAGSLVFELFITRPLFSKDNSGSLLKEMDRLLDRRTLLLLLPAAVICLVASTAEMLTKAALSATIVKSVTFVASIQNIVQTYWGHLWLWRTLILFGIIITAIMVLADWNPEKSGRRRWQIVSLVLAAGALFLISVVSHGAGITSLQLPGVFTDYVHLLAAGVWIGGIIYLAVVMPPAMQLYRREINDAGTGTFCPSSHVAAFRRFSFLALVSAGVLVITGLYSSWAQVTTWPAFITPYGITLLVKIGLVLILAALGAVSLIWVRPRLAESRAALTILKKTTRAQAITAVVVVMSVGLLISLNPARQAFTNSEPGQSTVPVTTIVPWGQISMRLEPGEAGPNKIVVSLTDKNGKPVNDATSVGVATNYLATNIGQDILYALPAGHGRYQVQTDLSISGNWEALIIVARPGQFDAESSVTFNVLVPGTNQQTIIAPLPRTGIILWVGEIVLIGLIYFPARWATDYFGKRSGQSR